MTVFLIVKEIHVQVSYVLLIVSSVSSSVNTDFCVFFF